MSFARSKRVLLLAGMMLSLSACAKEILVASPAPPLPVTEPYTKGEQRQAADELAGCDCPMLRRFMRDYEVLWAKLVKAEEDR